MSAAGSGGPSQVLHSQSSGGLTSGLRFWYTYSGVSHVEKEEVVWRGEYEFLLVPLWRGNCQSTRSMYERLTTACSSWYNSLKEQHHYLQYCPVLQQYNYLCKKVCVPIYATVMSCIQQ